MIVLYQIKKNYFFSHLNQLKDVNFYIYNISLFLLWKEFKIF